MDALHVVRDWAEYNVDNILLVFFPKSSRGQESLKDTRRNFRQEYAGISRFSRMKFGAKIIFLVFIQTIQRAKGESKCLK